MIRATPADKDTIVNILFDSFQKNKSVLYLVKQDNQKENRIRALMRYSVEYCWLFGAVYMSEDKKSCALILFPQLKRTTLRSIQLDLRLAFTVIGITHLKKVLAREQSINNVHPTPPFYYLWFIGVDPAEQGKGIGTRLLKTVIAEAQSKSQTVVLETSTLKNLPWYEKLGFSVYQTLDFGYTLYCLRYTR